MGEMKKSTSCHSSSGLVFFLPLVLAMVVHSSPAFKKMKSKLFNCCPSHSPPPSRCFCCCCHIAGSIGGAKVLVLSLKQKRWSYQDPNPNSVAVKAEWRYGWGNALFHESCFFLQKCGSLLMKSGATRTPHPDQREGKLVWKFRFPDIRISLTTTYFQELKHLSSKIDDNDHSSQLTLVHESFQPVMVLMILNLCVPSRCENLVH